MQIRSRNRIVANVDSIERHVTLPLDVDEAWRLVSDPSELATWIGTHVDLDPEPGATGEVVDPDGTCVNS